MKHFSAVLAAFIFASSAVSPTKPTVTALPADPGSALYIGNSFFYYNNSMHGHVSQLINAAKKDTGAAGIKSDFNHRSVSLTISGSGFDWHDVASYFRKDGLSKYSFGANNAISFNKIDKLFDVAIMMDCSQCPLHPQLKSVFKEFAKKHSDTVRANGAIPVFFMSWAYKDVPSMTSELAEEYTKAGNENKVMVIPAGLAFGRSVALKPDLDLYVSDLRHPSLAGTYLAACTTYAALFKRSPVGTSYTAGLPADIAKHLQEVAWATVQSYYAK